MIPDLRVFLDLDDLQRIADLERYIERSHKVLVFVSAGYAQSANAMRELRHSVETNKSLIALLEPEARRGGLTAEQMSEQLCFCEPIRGRALSDSLFAREPIEWNRIGCFQDVTLRLIAQRLLPAHYATYVQGDLARVRSRLPALANPPRPNSPQCGSGSQQSDWFNSLASLGGRLSTIGTSPASSAQFGAGTTARLDRERGPNYHLFCSTANMGAAAAAVEVQSKLLGTLHWTDQADSLSRCNAMLLYLTSRTWSGVDVESLAREVGDALQHGVQLVLAHEVPGVGQASRDPIEFATLFETSLTPPALVAAGVYSTIAVPLKGGPWREASLALLARAICEAESALPVIDRRMERLRAVMRRVGTAARLLTNRATRRGTSFRGTVEEEDEQELATVAPTSAPSSRKGSRSQAPSGSTSYRRSTPMPALGWAVAMDGGNRGTSSSEIRRGRSASDVRPPAVETRVRGGSVTELSAGSAARPRRTSAGLAAALSVPDGSHIGW